MVTDLGGTEFAVLAFALMAAFLAIRRHWRLAAFVAVTGSGLAVLGPVTKAVVDRARPVVDVAVVQTPSNASFPSGHAMTSVVLWGTLVLLALPAVGRRTRPWLVGARCSSSWR
ncbi:phosphatase PAP2 family protein [Blastococcus brunescens]|uniref:Phosphatase PAP2 family protein n=1 Tax=Blastococcus brunescens TaxID=1564165 RepID=A0ABZ1B8Y5_9ACTN|nr:phosphatase PAP2 family protein [Blastococcus sp. BMG 8361]WRL66273.1 phosphatase PAP2 family protein [Blastococcus sp. BMG 8361]